MTLSASYLPGAFDGLDILGITAALLATVLALRCALRPHYHSSRTRRKHDTRLWALVAVALGAVALYQLLGAQVLVHRFLPNFLDSVSDHGGFIEQAFYAAAGIAAMIMLLGLYGWLGGSINSVCIYCYRCTRRGRFFISIYEQRPTHDGSFHLGLDRFAPGVEMGNHWRGLECGSNVCFLYFKFCLFGFIPPRSLFYRHCFTWCIVPLSRLDCK